MKIRTSRKESLKEDIKHVLEELWDAEEEEPLYKIFSRECMNARGIQKILRHSKAQIQEVSCIDEDDTIHYLQKYEVGDVCMIVHYQ